MSAQTEQQQQEQKKNVTRRIALPAAASVFIAAAGVVVVRNIFTNLAGPEGKKATLKALSSEEESREGKVFCMQQSYLLTKFHGSMSSSSQMHITNDVLAGSA